VRESVSHNETGVLTERDEGLFADTITELLSDETRRKAMGEKAIRAIREFWTLEHAGDRLLHHIRRAVGG
jgi:glycosyltransferase involved in cell wall biosynthesis